MDYLFPAAEPSNPAHRVLQFFHGLCIGQTDPARRVERAAGDYRHVTLLKLAGRHSQISLMNLTPNNLCLDGV